MFRSFTLFLAIFLLNACLHVAKETWQTREPTVLMDNEKYCAADDECAVIEDLCGCSSMGVKYAIPKAQEEIVKARMKTIFGGVGCPEAMSADPSCQATNAQCIEHRCTLQL